MAELYVERAQRVHKHGFMEDPQPVPSALAATTTTTTSESSTPKLTRPISLSFPQQKYRTPPISRRASIESLLEVPSLPLNVSSPEIQEDLPPITNKSPTVPLHSMATSLSASFSSKHARAASASLPRPKYDPPPLMCRHSSLELISKVPFLPISESRTLGELSRITFNLASFLFARKLFQAALEVGELSLAEYHQSNDEFGKASTLHLLGTIASEQGAFAKAFSFFDEELEIRVKVQGEGHQEVLVLMDQLGWLKRRTGEHFGSLKHFSRSLTLQKQQGNRDDLTLSTLNGLGSVHTELGNLVQAQGYFKDALSLAASFERGLSVAQTLHNIGVLHTREGKWLEAHTCCEKAYCSRAEELEQGNILVAESMSLFGFIKMKLDDLNSAEDFLLKALAIQSQVAGNDHREVASTLSSLGVLEKRRNNLDKSQEYHEKALDIRSKLFGEQHPLTEASLRELGTACFSQGHFDKARDFFDRILSAQFARFGIHSHSRIQQTLEILEAVAKKQGLPKDVEYFSSKLNNQQNKQVANDLLEESTEWRAMKMIVLGNGQIGKTTFVRFLHSFLEPSVENMSFKSTIGIECRTMHIGSGRVGVFDFAGQMEYCVTHQHFLSSNLSFYVVCFDLSAPLNEQRRQIRTWLQYLNSLLTINKTTSTIPSCSIILVGTKADKIGDKQIIDNTHAYQQKFPSLHLINKIHHVSTLYDQTSARNLIVDIESQCSQIMNEHANLIPLSYQQLLKDISSITLPFPILPVATIQSLPNTQWNNKPDLMKRGLSHLHSVGEIVLFGDDKICRRPEEVSRLMARFISPCDVRNELLCDEEDQIAILTNDKISEILKVNANSNKIIDELELMQLYPNK